MTRLSSIVEHLNSLLNPEEYKDAALNGLQVDAGTDNVKKIALAVDSGLSVIQQAVEQEADLLLVHHGLFWGKETAVTGVMGEKIRTLMRGRCSLYASHLPLDGNEEVGNAFEIARALELEEIAGFAEYRGKTVGASGRLFTPQPLKEIVEAVEDVVGKTLTLPFGNDPVKTIGIVTGSGSFAAQLCPDQGIDLLITGEPKQEAYHMTKELKVNAIFAGHYKTETFGVLATGKRLSSGFDIETVFIDEPTGI